MSPFTPLDQKIAIDGGDPAIPQAIVNAAEICKSTGSVFPVKIDLYQVFIFTSPNGREMSGIFSEYHERAERDS